MIPSSSTDSTSGVRPALPFDRCYRAASYGFRVRSNIADAARFLDELFVRFRAENLNGVPTYSLVQLEGAQWPFTLYLDDTAARDRPWASPEAMIQFVVANVTKRAIASAEDFLVVHAAAASFEGRGILLPAASDSGKTTTVAGLTRAGFDYLTDEAALIHPRTKLVHPYPRPLAMSPRSVHAITGLGEQLSPQHHELGRAQYHVPPDELRPNSIGAPCPVRYIVSPCYSTGSVTRLEPMTRPETLMMLLRGSFNFSEFGSQGMHLLGDVVRGAACYRLRIGRLDDAVAAVRGLMDSTPVGFHSLES